MANQQLEGIERPVEIPRSTDGAAANLGAEPSWLLQQQQEQRRRESEVEALLGEERYREWHELNRTFTGRAEVSKLSDALEAAGEPLQTTQRESLVKIFSDEMERLSSKSANARSNLESTPMDSARHLSRLEHERQRIAEFNDRVKSQATKLLSAAQTEVLDIALDRGLAQASARIKVERAFTDARALTNSGPLEGETR